MLRSDCDGVAAFDDRRQVENGKRGHAAGSCVEAACRVRLATPQIQKYSSALRRLGVGGIIVPHHGGLLRGEKIADMAEPLEMVAEHLDDDQQRHRHQARRRNPTATTRRQWR